MSYRKWSQGGEGQCEWGVRERERSERGRESRRERDGCIVELKFSSAELCELHARGSPSLPLFSCYTPSSLSSFSYYIPSPPPLGCLACLTYSMAFYLLIKSLWSWARLRHKFQCSPHFDHPSNLSLPLYLHPSPLASHCDICLLSEPLHKSYTICCWLRLLLLLQPQLKCSLQ